MIKKTLCISMGMCLLFNLTYGQNPVVVDSLNLVLEGKTGGERFWPLYELVFEYLDRDNQKALDIIQQAEAAALALGDSLSIVKSKRVKAQMLSRLERIPESIRSAEEALAIAFRNGFVRERSMIINNLGASYLYEGHYDKAFQFFFDAMDLAQKGQDSSLFSLTLNNIGGTYYDLENYEKALDYHLRALEMSESINEVKYSEFMNVALSYANLKDYSKAQFYAKESLKRCQPNCAPVDFIQIKSTEALILFLMHEYRRAEKEFLTSYSLAKENKRMRSQFDNIYFLIEIYSKLGNLKSMKHFLTEAEQLINRSSSFRSEKLYMFSKLYKMYGLLGDDRKVAHYQGKYIQLKDSIYNNQLTNRLMATEAKFLERENEARIEEQNEIIFLKEEVIERQIMLNVVIGMLGLITLAFLLLLFRNFRRKNDINVMLEQRIKQRTLELELSREVLQRKLIERDLAVKRFSETLAESLNTIKGLCLVGRKENSDPLACLAEIDKMLLRVDSSATSYLRKKVRMPTA